MKKVLRGLPAFISNKIKKKGTAFIVSGPSGCGKTTLCGRLLKRGLGLMNSISVTTRPPRKGEKGNRDYIFIKEKEFKKLLQRKSFLEHARVFGHYYYGTPKEPVLDALKRNKDVLLCIDVQGAAKIKRIVKDAAFIFILPPSFKELRKRLTKRSSDTAAQIRKRLEVARVEMRSIDMYDYMVINDDMETATDQLVSIVKAARCKIHKPRTSSIN